MVKKIIVKHSNVKLYYDSSVKYYEKVIFLNGGAEQSDLIWEKIKGCKCVLAVISGFDWNADLSPWPAEKVFKNGEDFQGNAKSYLNSIVDEIIPAAEAELRNENVLQQKVSHYIAGYSLAGLFAVWSLYNTDVFDGAASVSGSLWYNGFSEYIEKKHLNKMPEKVYFSVGAKEKKTQNKQMAAVENVTEMVYNMFKEKGVDSIFEINEGGHFTDIELRIAKGIRYLVQ